MRITLIYTSSHPCAAHYYAELLNYFSRALQNREAAADVVQESYARVLGMDGQALVRDMRALLYRTGKNIVIDDARRRRVEAGMLETLGLIHRDEAPSADRIASARQQLSRLAVRLATLPRRRREAFILVRVYGHTHAEAAEHQGVSVEAIEKHVVRAVCDLMDLATAHAA
ncbi:sigma-70 family RNA polymerase sigma factor [Hydrogenophaga sp. UC242_53]|uniref:sigma-70 family RNA polymerase sigma factor n=1 Tax=Hydrogenophaga sp. UC242_53 TaxID=3350170 RepID=UPI0036D34FB1